MKTFTHEWKFYPKYPTNKRMLTNTSRHYILITWITDTVKNNENVFLLKLNVYQIDQSNVKQGWMYLAQMFPLICQPQPSHVCLVCARCQMCVLTFRPHVADPLLGGSHIQPVSCHLGPRQAQADICWYSYWDCRLENFYISPNPGVYSVYSVSICINIHILKYKIWNVSSYPSVTLLDSVNLKA